MPYISDGCFRASSFISDGDIIMADTAEDETVGKATEVLNVRNNKLVSGLHTMWLHPINQEKYALGYLGYAFNASIYHNQLLPLMQGTKVTSISKTAIKDTYILIPQKSEQNRIAKALSNVDALISELAKLIEKKRAIKQGAMQQLLTGKKRLKGFEDKWVEKKLGEVGNTIRGVSFTPELSSVEKKYQYIPLLRSNNIFDYKLNGKDLLYVDKSCVSDNQIMQDKDVLICAANGSRQLVGKSANYHVNETTTFGAFMCVFRCFEGECNEFFSNVLQSDDYKKQLDDILTGSAINNLNGSQIERMYVQNVENYGIA